MASPWGVQPTVPAPRVQWVHGTHPCTAFHEGLEPLAKGNSVFQRRFPRGF